MPFADGGRLSFIYAPLALRLIGAPLRHFSPFDAKSVRQTDAQDSVWRLSFGRRSVASINTNGEHHTLFWTPSQGVSIRLERKDLQITKPNSLLDLDFLVSRGNRTIDNHKKLQTSKTNNQRSLITSKRRGRDDYRFRNSTFIGPTHRTRRAARSSRLVEGDYGSSRIVFWGAGMGRPPFWHNPAHPQ